MRTASLLPSAGRARPAMAAASRPGARLPGPGARSFTGGRRLVPLRAPRPAPLLVKEAASTERALVEESSSSNGNGNDNGAGPHAAVSGSANGAAAAYAAADAGAVIAVGSNGEACAPDDIACELEGFMDPGSSGSLMTAAEEALSAREAAAAAAAAAADAVASTSDAASAATAAAAAAAASRSSAGTPYSAPGGRWARFKKYSAFQRSWEIWTFALAFFFRLWLVGRAFTYGRAGMTEARVSARRSALAVWLREGLVRLGPTFIKVGQQFSTRIDVLSPEFIKELEVLQDNVPPFPSETAVAIVEAAFGKPLLETYESFDPVPIAAASLGQVHVARVGGRKVVVKVQRPGLKALFDIDLKNVRALAQWLQAVDPKSDGAARDWVAIYDECSRILYQEIDYTAEGRNADEFRQNFAKVPWVKVPEVVWELTTPEVLTMEYAPGVKINRVAELDRMGVDRQLLARRTVESYLQQILTHGLFHADPHPGNVAVDAEGGGRLVYYDFGMMGRIPNDVRGGLVELFYAVYQKDVDGCMSALVKMGVLVPGGDPVAVRRTGEFFLRSFEDRLAAQRAERAENEAAYTAGYKPAASKEDKKAKRKQLLAAIGEDLLVASSDKPFRFPATFTFVVRSFTVLDGIGKGLDPRFDISEISAPYARELLLEGSPQYARVRKDLAGRLAEQNRAVANLFRGPNLIQDSAATLAALRDGDLKLRVRALEAERALARAASLQRATLAAVLASALVNVGTVLSVSAMGAAAAGAFAGAGVLGLLTAANLLKLRLAEQKEAQLAGV